MSASVRDFFVEMGRSAEARLGEIATETEGLERRRSRLEQVEELLDRMAADGQLTGPEVEQLLQEVRAAGLDATGLARLLQELAGTDGALGGEAADRFARAAGDQLGRARAGVQDQLYDLRGEIHAQMSTVSIGYTSAADFNKKQHDIAMAIIRNFSA